MSGCYRCGSSQGSDLQLCPDCGRAYDAKRDALRSNLRVNTDSDADSFIHQLFSNSRVQANVLVVVWYLLIFVLVMLGSEIGVPMGVGLVLATLITSAGLFFLTIFMSWLSLMVFDLVQGLIVMFFPPMIYRLFLRMWQFRYVNSEWSNHKGIVLAHVLSIVMFLGAINCISLVGDAAVVRADRLFQRHYGFSPARFLISAGIVKKEY